MRENGAEDCRATLVVIRENWIYNVEATAKSWWVIRFWVRKVWSLFSKFFERSWGPSAHWRSSSSCFLIWRGWGGSRPPTWAISWCRAHPLWSSALRMRTADPLTIRRKFQPCSIAWGTLIRRTESHLFRELVGDSQHVHKRTKESCLSGHFGDEASEFRSHVVSQDVIRKPSFRVWTQESVKSCVPPTVGMARERPKTPLVSNKVVNVASANAGPKCRLEETCTRRWEV